MTYITTLSKQRFDFLNPHEYEFDIEEIAHALSHINRYVGHTQEPYNVAQHSVLVSTLYTNNPLEGLIHDTPEAFTGDINTPLKQLMGKEFKDIENNIYFHIKKYFNINREFYDEKGLKEADMTAYYLEAYHLKDEFYLELEEIIIYNKNALDIFKSKFHVWDSKKSFTIFMERFEDLYCCR